MESRASAASTESETARVRGARKRTAMRKGIDAERASDHASSRNENTKIAIGTETGIGTALVIELRKVRGGRSRRRLRQESIANVATEKKKNRKEATEVTAVRGMVREQSRANGENGVNGVNDVTETRTKRIESKKRGASHATERSKKEARREKGGSTGTEERRARRREIAIATGIATVIESATVIENDGAKRIATGGRVAHRMWRSVPSTRTRTRTRSAGSARSESIVTA
mmetsp:Transcript_2257/g.6462  ORF Transcript_2257/g.6462 Transcript_2257/m.6462 type:complete len:231 (+) Transcript_2257:294-986(+)